ncbi:hypothetical protein WME73_05825 [Sorangium sp. So ce302]|uniref:hypothetical protein n=1 Tax=Sorangium sp. So ce302 TaxID=3133297 RepID=UPI003F5FC666
MSITFINGYKNTTGYIVGGIELPGRKVYRILVNVDPTKPDPLRGEVVLDPNTGTLDQFGDSQPSTKIALERYRMELPMVATGGGKALMDVRYTEGAGPKLQLVSVSNPLDANQPQLRLLVLGGSGIQHVLNLEQF